MTKKGKFGYLDKDAKNKMRLAFFKAKLETAKVIQPTTKKGEVAKKGEIKILNREIDRLSSKSRKNQRKRSDRRKRKSRTKRRRTRR